ncbi:hypothetical protein BB561_000922 [Smittium simulii]|uniref:Sister chromatid cohesion protein DCC1 n=1 Tax=Smittium simulii TaxID=133385 RepID=A0A2T9YWY8_9FUNG|nr:hypothetical protein BB561_000922 [Smittium simulii]
MIKQALQDIPAVYFQKEDSYRILSKSFVVGTLELILANCVVNDWNVRNLSLDLCTAALDEETDETGVELAAIIECVLSKFGNKVESGNYAINGSKVLRFYARKLLEADKHKKWNFYNFISTWKQNVPPMFVDMIPGYSEIDAGNLGFSVLRGLGVIDYENVGNLSTELATLKYFDKLETGNSVVQRLNKMFQQRSFWLYEELLEHLEDVAGYSGFDDFFGDGKTYSLGPEINMGKACIDQSTGNKVEFKMNSKPKHQIDQWISIYTVRQKRENNVVYISSSHLKYSAKMF